LHGPWGHHLSHEAFSNKNFPRTIQQSQMKLYPIFLERQNEGGLVYYQQAQRN
jgi:hypothetical protein